MTEEPSKRLHLGRYLTGYVSRLYPTVLFKQAKVKEQFYS